MYMLSALYFNCFILSPPLGQSTFISVTPTGSIVAKTLSRGRLVPLSPSSLSSPLLYLPLPSPLPHPLFITSFLLHYLPPPLPLLPSPFYDGRFNVTVIATDGGTPPMNSTAVVSVTVLGVNSNSPVFTNVVVSPRTSVSINEVCLLNYLNAKLT